MDDGTAARSSGIDQTAAGKITNGLIPEDLVVSRRDRGVLRASAEQVAEIAVRASMAERRDLWRRHNMLESTRPLIFCDPENGWNEIINADHLACDGNLARKWEMDLRKEVFWGDRMGDDKPVEPFFDVPNTARQDDWGLGAVFHQTQPAGSYVWDAPIKHYERDLPRLHSPSVDIDWDATDGCLSIATDLLGDLLSVRLKGMWWWSLGLTWTAATLRGLQNVLVPRSHRSAGWPEGALGHHIEGASGQARLSRGAWPPKPQQRRDLRRFRGFRFHGRAASGGLQRDGALPRLCGVRTAGEPSGSWVTSVFTTTG